MHINNAFKKRLASVLPAWVDEGLISDGQSKAISQKYELEELSRNSVGILLGLIYGIGAVLIAVGIISFVAAHWDGIGEWTKIGLVTGAMIGFQAMGFYLWKISEKMPKLGHGLVLLGTLIVGADIALVCQVFNISGEGWGLFMLWSAGAAMMGYAMMSVPIMTAGVIIATIGGLTQDWGIKDYQYWILPYVLVVFGVYCYRARSRVCAVAIVVGAAILMGSQTAMTFDDDYAFATVMLMGAIALNIGLVSVRIEKFRGLGRAMVEAGFWAAILGLYVYTFVDVVRDIQAGGQFEGIGFYVLLVYAGVWAATAMVSMLLCGGQKDRAVLALLINLAVVGLAGGIFLHEYAGTAINNVFYVAIASVLIGMSFWVKKRHLFWKGAILVGVIIVSRSLEYETQLMIKAAAFVGCGIGLIAGGIVFEKFLKAKGAK